MNTNFDALLQYHSNFILSLSVICKDIFLENMTATDISLANAKYITWYRFELKLKNTLERIQYRSLPSCNSIKTFDFSTLYTLFPHSKLKDRLWSELCFIKKNDQRRYKYLALGWDKSYFAKKKKKTKKKTTLILPKSSLKLVSTCSSVWLTTYFVMFEERFN